ncbi:prephenate dehydrogenase [Fusibacter sp. JL216-2]|uniref:prephenate dehydrogenase n=1 Tax=Fusibacter sp. JL216-2 TaxID=3071453 RepID=UPI003D348B16
MLDEIDFITPFKTIGVIGTGLMGGSFAKAIKANIKYVKVIGYDVSERALSDALVHKCIDEPAKDLEDIARKSDLLVLATPVRTYENILMTIPKDVWKNTFLTDLGSVKSHPNHLVKKILPENTKYVGGHPMAGSEKCGCENSSEYLFNNNVFYLTSDQADWIKPVRQLVEKIGAVVKEVDVEDHDRIVSVSSHVPHVAASLLVQLLHEDINISETGGGYQDTTRIAGSDPVMWTDIFLSNKNELLKSLSQFQKGLEDFIDIIQKEDEQDLFDLLKQTRQKRLFGGEENNGDINGHKAV